MSTSPDLATLAGTTTRALEGPSRARRRALDAGPTDRGTHTRLTLELGVLGAIEDARAPASPVAQVPLRIAFWNTERCKHPHASAALLARTNAAVNLLCEMDLGMARSGQAHTTQALAGRLGQGYLFGVEFVELGLGDARERATHAGQENRHGLHGAALVSAYRLERPTLVRLETSGDWFDGSRGERRIGGRIALVATLATGRGSLTLVSVHLESHGDPHSRGVQMACLLEALERYGPGDAVLVGGDFNTQSAPRDALVDARARSRLLEVDPARLSNPVPHEPLFAVAAEHGYHWSACNVAGACTKRRLPHHPPDTAMTKLDWFFSRGLRASRPEIVPAVDPRDGSGISDHELIAVTIEMDQAR